MSVFAKVFEALQQAIVLADRVETLSRAVEGMAREVREMDRRLSRMEGALNMGHGDAQSPAPPPRLPRPKDPAS
jgi:uncharacterized membrane protein YccC